MKKFLFSKKDILGGIAKWAVHQSPYHRPDNLEIVIDKLNELISPMFSETDLSKHFMELSYQEIQDFVLGHCGQIPEFMAWNEPKIQTGNPLQGSSSRYHKTKPDYDYIDLHALARNVANDILRDQIGIQVSIPLILGDGSMAREA